MKKILFDKENEKRPYVAVNAVITKLINKKRYILLGKRKNVAGAGYWYLLGGHIHMNEPYKEALKREIFEESGLLIKVGEPVWIKETLDKPNLHHIIIYCDAKLTNPDKELINKEPNKCEEIKWFLIDKLPNPLWHDLGTFIEHYKKNMSIFVSL